MLAFKSAKEKWDTLKKIHQENQDVKRDKIIALEEEFNSLQMGDNEDIEDFHSRFLGVVNKLAFLGETIDE